MLMIGTAGRSLGLRDGRICWRCCATTSSSSKVDCTAAPTTRGIWPAWRSHCLEADEDPLRVNDALAGVDVADHDDEAPS